MRDLSSPVVFRTRGATSRALLRCDVLVELAPCRKPGATYGMSVVVESALLEGIANITCLGDAGARPLAPVTAT